MARNEAATHLRLARYKLNHIRLSVVKYFRTIVCVATFPFKMCRSYNLYNSQLQSKNLMDEMYNCILNCLIDYKYL
jgi:hypothetical protein